MRLFIQFSPSAPTGMPTGGGDEPIKAAISKFRRGDVNSAFIFIHTSV